MAGSAGEEYTKHAKAFFRVGKTTDESWKAPVGMNLELVPLSDPTRASSSEPFRVQVFRGGQPLPAFAVVALIDSTTPRQFATTGPDGVASFQLNRQGRWLIEGTDLRETPKSLRPCS